MDSNILFIFSYEIHKKKKYSSIRTYKSLSDTYVKYIWNIRSFGWLAEVYRLVIKLDIQNKKIFQLFPITIV